MSIVVRPLTQKALWAIQASHFSRALVDASKAVPGMVWDASTRSWTGYIDAVEATCDILASKGVRVDRSLLDNRPVGYKHNLLYAVKGADGRALREYQKTGVDFLIARSREGAIEASQMGLGKSAMAIVTLRALGGRSLVIVPSAARSVWLDEKRGELSKWWPAVLKNTLALDGTRPLQHRWRFLKKVGTFVCAQCNNRPKPEEDQGEPPTAEPKYAGRKPLTVDDCTAAILPTAETRLVVCHYDILWAWVDVLKVWDPAQVVWDEGHMLQTEKSRRSKASKEIAHRPSVTSRIVLTGTPLMNRVRDLWNLVDTISPGRFGKNCFSFQRIHCDGKYEEISRDIGAKWKAEGATNIPQLQKRLNHFVLRRTTEEVQLELPEKTRQVIRLEVPIKFHSATNGSLVDKRLINAILAKAVDGKVPQVVDLLRDHLEGGTSVIGFTYRQSIAEHLVTQLAPLGIMCRFIHGGILPSKRQAILNELREESLKGPVFLAATIDTCATAIDLTFATVAVFAELSYEPHKLLQAESRPHRYPQRSTVLIQYPIAMNTIEEVVAEVVIDRLDTFEKLIGKTDGLARALAGDEEIDLIKQLGDRLFAMTAPSASEEPRTKTRKKAKA
jgi:SNF2 family DNA or RNA helicase